MRFSVSYDGPPKGYGNSGSKKLYIAIHNTSNGAPPKNEASYAKRRNDSVSSHFYADASTVIQSLDTKYDAWHAGSRAGNTKAIAFELVGTNGSSESYWRKVIDRIAPVIAEVCKAHGIAVRHLSIAEAKALNKSGIVTHDDMRRAWGGTTHTDPGPHFPMDYLVQRVNAHLNPTPAPPKPKPPASKPALKVDGALGRTTITRWQQVMGTPVDGVISRPSELTKGVQKHLNAKIRAGLDVDGIGIAQDGQRTNTIAALQRYLGTPVDGVLSPGRSKCVEELQERLNSGKF